MANTRFVRPTDNRTQSTIAQLRNGASGPPLIQDAAYPMSNLMNKDRYSVWASGAAVADPIVVHIDMGTSVGVRLFGVLGLRAAAGGNNPFNVTFGFRISGVGYSSDPSQYTVAGQATTSFVADAMLEIAPTFMRYLQFSFAMPGAGWGNGFSLGKCMASTSISDMGIIYSPGAERTIVTPQIRTRAESGIPTLTVTGLPHAEFRLPFRTIGNTPHAILNNIGGLTDPFVYLDQNSSVYECLPARSEWKRSHQWSPPDAWDVDFDFEQLP